MNSWRHGNNSAKNKEAIRIDGTKNANNCLSCQWCLIVRKSTSVLAELVLSHLPPHEIKQESFDKFIELLMSMSEVSHFDATTVILLFKKSIDNAIMDYQSSDEETKKKALLSMVRAFWIINALENKGFKLSPSVFDEIDAIITKWGFSFSNHKNVDKAFGTVFSVFADKMVDWTWRYNSLRGCKKHKH